MKPLVISFICLCASMAYAQSPPTLVVNTGMATVTEAPNVAEIVVERIYQDHDLVVAMAQAGNFEGRLRETFNNNKLYPTEIMPVPPYIRNLQEGEVVAAVKLQFVLPRLGNTVERVTQVAQLRSVLNSMAESMQFSYSELEWKPENIQKTEQDAVVRATENAYAYAESVAHSLENAINNVDSVEVLSVEWNLAPGQPNMNEVSCTAKVKVVYALQTN